MLKIITSILTMVLGGVIYQYFFAEVPNYMTVFSMLYWSIITTVTFLMTGAIKLENKK